MRFARFRALCPVTILVLFLASTLSATTDYGFALSVCKTEPPNPLVNRQWSRYGSDNSDLISTIGSTQGCPTTRQLAYIGIVADCTYVSEFNSTDSLRDHVHDIVNRASVVYENSFNISLQIRNLTISDPDCPSRGSGDEDWNAPCSTGDLNWRLREFSSWRASLDDDNPYWTLLTGCSTNGGEVGVSYIGALCESGSRYGYRSGTSVNVVARTQNEWQVFA